ncbi:MAG: DUF4278 domain-containing protein [Kastovskya adunca ATA6-11-RM4]|jgi:hypothetical protein|nr:DUF4278 domain-containing protein [Kastovskya adunca ATA6-11-RM4]
MKLSYRGISYDYNPPKVEATESKTVGKYRGLDWRFRNLKKPFVQQATVDLKYRGAAYQAAINPEVATTLSTQDKARYQMLNQERAALNRQRAMLNRATAELA